MRNCILCGHPAEFRTCATCGRGAWCLPCACYVELPEIAADGPDDLCAECYEEVSLLRVLGSIAEHDETGRHFTVAFPRYDELEDRGWIKISRPIHGPTGIPMAEEYWHCEVTPAGIAAWEKYSRGL